MLNFSKGGLDDMQLIKQGSHTQQWSWEVACSCFHSAQPFWYEVLIHSSFVLSWQYNQPGAYGCSQEYERPGGSWLLCWAVMCHSEHQRLPFISLLTLLPTVCSLWWVLSIVWWYLYLPRTGLPETQKAPLYYDYPSVYQFKTQCILSKLLRFYFLTLQPTL